MSSVRVSLRDAGRRVRLDLEDLEGATARELEHALLLLGAHPHPSGFSTSVLTFRRGAVELARLLRRLDADVILDEGIQQLLRTQLTEITALREAEEPLEPPAPGDVLDRVFETGRVRCEPNERQVENLGRLLALRHGANFSVPGAGKTSTLLGIYEALRARGVVDRLLVIAPKNAFIAWEDEVERCFYASDRPVIRRLAGGAAGVETALAEDPEISLITYQLLPNVEDHVKVWALRHRTHVVLDESHRVKGGRPRLTAAAALDLSGVAVRRDILSGTPLPHSAEDLRAQLDFLWPGQRILPDLRIATEAPIRVLEDVERAVRPLYVRTTKAQLDLPDYVLDPIPVTLGPLQRELYDVLRSEAARAASGMHRHDQRFFRLLGRHVVRLLQAAVNPMLLTQGELVDRAALEPVPEGTRAWELLRELARYEQPAKIARAMELSERLIATEEKVLIWTQFVMNVRALERLLSHHGAVVLYGQVPTGDDDDPGTREGRIRAFHEDPNTKVMIANPAAAGEGISLHRACQHAIYLDRSFNAAHFLQSVDRIHRLGLPDGVKPEVHILYARGTIDGRVASRLNKKITAMQLILNDDGLAALAYDPGDLEEELAGGIEPEDVEEIVDHLDRPADED